MRTKPSTSPGERTPRGIIIAAPASGSGKTTVTLALLRALRNAGLRVASAKAGPDYIDPAFHTAASGQPCYNLDTWAMRGDTLARIINGLGRSADLIVAEGVMGLFDGAPDGRGSAADLARRTGWPVLLVVDCGGMAASIAALAQGFASFDPGVHVDAVFLNRVGRPAHAELLKAALQAAGLQSAGYLTRDEGLALPDRHLGLVQAQEHGNLEAFLERAALALEAGTDLDTLVDRAAPMAPGSALEGTAANERQPALSPLGQHIAVARDEAFAFLYPHLLDAWSHAGASLSFFSPLANERPAPSADAILLPGGYPELHGETLAAAYRFRAAMGDAARSGKTIYGECGGYMALGRALIDREGRSHEMCGLLPVTTSFESPRLHLGYRQLEVITPAPDALTSAFYRGHEFHFASEVENESDTPLFRARTATGEALGAAGARNGTAAGSYMHLVDRFD